MTGRCGTAVAAAGAVLTSFRFLEGGGADFCAVVGGAEVFEAAEAGGEMDGSETEEGGGILDSFPEAGLGDLTAAT
jgi:hypothetical protein